MIESRTENRMLAFAVRSRSYGYVVFEGPKMLIDWGEHSFRRGVNAVRVPAAAKVGALLDELAPAVVVLNERVTHRTRRHAGLIGSIVKQAKQRGIPVKFLPRRVVDRAFVGHNENRHQIASLVVSEFPELAIKLPPKRRCQDNEDYRMNIFDAVALSVAYFSRDAKRFRDASAENSFPVPYLRSQDLAPPF